MANQELTRVDQLAEKLWSPSSPSRPSTLAGKLWSPSPARAFPETNTIQAEPHSMQIETAASRARIEPVIHMEPNASEHNIATGSSIVLQRNVAKGSSIPAVPPSWQVEPPIQIEPTAPQSNAAIGSSIEDDPLSVFATSVVQNMVHIEATARCGGYADALATNISLIAQYKDEHAPRLSEA